MDRTKEIQRLIYIKSELIKQTKKEIKELQIERDNIEGQKRLERKKTNGKGRNNKSR